MSSSIESMEGIERVPVVYEWKVAATGEMFASAEAALEAVSDARLEAELQELQLQGRIEFKEDLEAFMEGVETEDAVLAASITLNHLLTYGMLSKAIVDEAATRGYRGNAQMERFLFADIVEAALQSLIDDVAMP